MRVEVISVQPKSHPACLDNRKEIVKLKIRLDQTEQDITKMKIDIEQLNDTDQFLIQLRIDQLKQKE